MSCTDARYSFELYPPRTERAAAALPATIDRLAAVHPDFISVTYGAGGSSRTASLDVLRYIIERTDVSAMAHLTCVGSSHEEAHRLIREFLDAGIRRFLAVRGDPPADLPAGEDGIGDIRTTAELVQLIHRVQAERAPYGELSVPGLPAQAVLQHREHVQIAVAAFPNGHPSSHSISQDIDALLAKQAAGANLGITQLFFHAEDYLHFAQRAAEAGVTFPILPGIMPVTSPARLKRMLELSGEDLPSDLAIELEVEPTDEGRREIGIDWAARLGRRLLDGGAPGLHLYTFNQHEAVLSMLDRIGVLPEGGAEHTHTPKKPATEKETA
ncbi:methylenetetrahydrofolate reductase [Leifsonia sp. C5G2]|uniref:methylenetetrahydrofolate reductase n=1 Tax=Leifsonia sp. C5G2 TaxID=2735269 RepID=UPI0015852787|nr:methylenetetrahydrofolate reductase [Leifsonia sp. C5G2]NUU08037.1 5,10-methylenetetrahydrofolate reductase [Leifsonia sp. C5G2]